MTPFAVADIARQCGDANAPGLKQLFYIQEEKNVAAIPAATADTLKVETAITMEGVNVFKTWDISKEGSSFESNQEGAVDSKIVKTVVKAFIPKLTPEASWMIANVCSGCPYILIVPDKNDQLRILGEKGDGAYVNFKEMTNDKNGYELEIIWESALPPLYYTAAIPL